MVTLSKDEKELIASNRFPSRDVFLLIYTRRYASQAIPNVKVLVELEQAISDFQLGGE